MKALTKRLVDMSLQTRVIALVLPAVACFVAVAAIAVVSWFAANERAGLERQLAVLPKLQRDALATPLWQVDDQEVRRLVELIGAIPDRRPCGGLG